MNFVRQIWTYSHKCFSTLLFPQKNRTTEVKHEHVKPPVVSPLMQQLHSDRRVPKSSHWLLHRASSIEHENVPSRTEWTWPCSQYKNTVKATHAGLSEEESEEVQRTVPSLISPAMVSECHVSATAPPCDFLQKERKKKKPSHSFLKVVVSG